MRRRLAGFSLVACVAALAACGVATDDNPRDLAPANEDVTGTDVKTVITATSTSFVYLASQRNDGDASGGQPPLEPVPRDIAESAESVLRALLAGPTAREANAGFTTAIPTGTRLLSVVLDGDLATVNISDGLSTLTGSALLTAVGQIVLTATEVVGIGSVAIQEAGAPLILPDAVGALHSEPLERADVEPLKADGTPTITAPATTP